MLKKNILILFVLLLLILSCKENKILNNTKADKIKVGYMPDFSGTSAVTIAKEKGYFEDEDLDVSLVEFLDGPSAINAMRLRNVNFAYIGHGAHSLAILGKVNVLFPNGLSKSEQIIVNNSAAIDKVADLKGKTIAASFGTSAEIFLNLALKTSGIKEGEVNIVNMDGPNIVSAMVNKTIDGASIHAPYTFDIMDKLGDQVKVIATIEDYSNVGIFPSSWVVTPEYQNENPDIVNRFSRAILRAMDYRSTNIDEAIQISAVYDNKDIETMTLEKETGIWLSGEDVKNAYLDGTAARWYKVQQDIFIYTKVITNNVDINDYVQIKYMNENIFNK